MISYLVPGLLLAALPATRWADTTVAVSPLPASPLIERIGANQYLNFDFILVNRTRWPLRLVSIEVSVHDDRGRLAVRKFVDRNGFNSGLSTIGRLDLPVGRPLKIYNPFAAIDSTLTIGRMEYRFRFVKEATPAARRANEQRLPIDWDLEILSDVRPVAYAGKTDLVLPMKGPVIVYDGHDFYAHHRRQPSGLPGALPHNPVRYAYDFVSLDSAGALYSGSPFVTEHWDTYGKEVLAPGGGVVVAALNGVPDNRFQGRVVVHPKPAPPDDPFGLGNHVIIDHENGEFSYLLHLKPGSVRVRPGDRVRRGQLIGQVGFSGDAFIPHLHYMVADGPNLLTAEGLPSSFSDFERLLGSRAQRVTRGPVETGDIVLQASQP